LVSEEEANHCTERGEYYSILPMLPELQITTDKESNALIKEYSSADDVLDLEGTIELLRKHKLMVDDVQINSHGELLR
jgi:UDP-glucose 4-epimerase